MPDQTDTPDFADQDQAFREGWIIAWVDDDNHPPFELQRLDEAAVFENDMKAWEFVVRKAYAGSEYHQRALKFIADNSPDEFEVIETHAALALGLNSVSALFSKLEV